MEDNNKKLEDETLEMISGAGDDDYLVDYNSPCPCGGSHDWVFIKQLFHGTTYNPFLHECSKCHRQTEI